ncbi:aldo/keto reductase [Amycolatopsis sp. GM8]|uniref:aldo/keto reductase n=1 Tax=Amycolatopsis sp. GM8 TaxID=2896530 RepID=UPI001F3C56C7|nr:aldo/keto reductase [Amycolatopsis sp. GM8]
MVSTLPGRLALGGANLGNMFAPMSDEQAHAILDAAWGCGIRHFDTAPHYGLGLSERRLGAFLAGKPREEFVVSTKVGRRLVPDPGGTGLDDANLFHVPADQRRVWDFSAGGVRRGLEESLIRLGLDSVDIVYLHDPDEYDLRAALAEGLPAVVALRDEGVVSAVGLGSKSAEALEAGARSGMLDVLMVAGRFTLLDQSFAPPESLEVLVAGVFNSGVLSTSAPAESAYYDYAPIPHDVLVKAREIAAVCAEFGVELPTAALHFPLLESTVRAVVIGAVTPEHVWQNYGRLYAVVPGELWTSLRDKGLIRWPVR